MASGRIKGITIEIGGDATKLNDALRDVDKNLKSTNDALKDVNKLLKFDPKNAELLAQKQKLLKDAIGQTKDRLEELKKAQSQVKEGTAEWDALQREIADTEQKLESLENQYRDFGSVAQQQIEQAGKSMQEAGEKIKGVGEKLAPVSAAAAAFGGGLLKLGYDAVTSADDLNTLSKQTGLSTETLQKMSYAADLVDVSVEDITGALRKMKPKMDENNATFEKLGVKVKDADGNLRDAESVFYDTLTALSKVGNETERDQLAMDIFGKSADSLAGIIDDGGQALQTFGEEAADAGIILSQDTLDALNQTNDTIDELKANFAATAGQIGADVAVILTPVLESLSDVCKDITEALRDMDPEQEKVILAITGVLAVAAPLIIFIGSLVGAIGTIATALAPVIALLSGPLVLAIGGAIAAGVLIIANWDKIKDACRQMKEGVINDFNTIKTGLTNAAENIKKSVSEKFEAAKKAVTDAINKIKDVVNNAKLQLPKFKLPHFKIYGGQVPWGIGGMGTKPTISVEWYKKAHENAIIFTKPTIMPTLTGYKGFGDGGAEAVVDYSKLMEMAGDTYITVNAAPGMDVRQLADEVQLRLAQVQKQRASVYA